MNEAMMSKAKEAKTAIELMELAKAEHIELTEEQAKKLFAQLHAEGEISDNELDGVVGGGCGDTTIRNYRCGDIVALTGGRQCKGCKKGSLFEVTYEWGSNYEVECTTCYTLHIVTDGEIAGRVR